jgi:hypothetical protein
MIAADIGVATPLELMLFDGAAGKGVRVRIRTTAGALVSTVDLSHVGEGLYTSVWIPATEGYYHANYVVYTDAFCTTEDLLYSRTTETYRVELALTPENIAEQVWEQALVDHSDPGTFGWAINELLINTEPGHVADEVWDALVADHQIPDSFGDWVRATHQWASVITDEVTHGIWGLHALHDLIQNRANQTDSYVLLNGTKIDALTPFINGVEATILSAIDTNRILLTNMEIQNATDKAEIIAEIVVAEGMISSIAGLVSTLQNNTTTRFVVPERLIKPVTGTKTYQFHLRMYDAAGNPEAPDSVPTIRVRRLDTGVDIVNGALMVQDGAKVGAYYYVHTIGAGTNDYPALVEATVVENGVTRYVPAVTEITEFESDLNALQAQLAAVGVVVDNSYSQITNPTYGLAALKTGENSILMAIAAQGVVIGQIKSRTDLIPANIATTTDINDVLMQLAELPRLPEITTVVNNARDNIKGPDGRDLSDVYDLWDTTDLMRTSDPRLNFLDAAISSRSTITPSDVWHYGTRTLTDFSLDNTSIRNIWAYATSQALTLPNSMGKYLIDMLDVRVSTRAEAADIMAALAGVAQEDTLLGTRSAILNDLAAIKSQLTNITGKVIAIQGKTNNLPSDPASENTVTMGTVQIREDLTDLTVIANAIRSKTTNLPIDPAREASVHAIPTNPVLVSDPRLTNLDAKISTRSTLQASDLAPLAKTTDVTAAKDIILDELEGMYQQIGDLSDLSYQIKSHTDRIPVDPATLAALSAAETAILDAIADIAIGGGGATPADIWSYAHRTITQDPSTFGPDISNLATKSDVTAARVQQYVNRMTTTFSPERGEQEVLVWAEKNGSRVAVSNSCTIIVADALGVVKWTQSSSIPNSDGVYRFINPIVVSADSNYYIVMSINVDGEFKISQQAFITIG